MTARKSIIYLTVALLPTLWDCSADETIHTLDGGAITSDSTIRFAVNTEAICDIASTRGETINNTTEFETTNRQFTVAAYDYRNDIGEQLMIGTQSSTTINGDIVTYNGTTWTTTKHYYWPQISHTVHFYAAYPVVSLTKTANDVAATCDAKCDTSDPLIAYLDMGRTEASEHNYYAPLKFRHAMAKISFKAETSVDGWKLTIKQIKIHNLYTKGIVGIHYGVTTPSDISAESGTFTMTNNQSDGQLVVLPQKREAWHPEYYKISENDNLTDTISRGTYLAIECALWDDNYNNNTGGYRLGEGSNKNEITGYQTIYCPVAPAWQSNRHYKYTLQFMAPGYGSSAFKEDGTPIYDLASVTLTANQIEDWTTGNSNTIHVK